jgi:peptidoglycan/xylan/chitin deacetylase (PgdA/CDA1 family)
MISARTKGALLRKAATVLAPPRLMVVRARRSGPRVALTFDDGPDEHTVTLLDLLDRLRVRSTFFVIGERCVRRRAELHEIVRRGHEVAPHGFTHKRFPLLSRETLRDELARSAEVLPPSLRRPALLRPPGGHVSLGTLAQCARHGYTTVLWSVDSLDAQTRDPAEVADNAAAAEAGDIVLLHEGQSWTNEALPQIVERLRARGLEPSTVGEML